MPRLGFIKTLRPMLPIHFHVPLHGDYRHAERLHNFFRPHGPSHDHLTREHPEAPYICLLVLKHRQVSVHITNLVSFAKTDPAKNQWFREGEMLPLDGRRRNRYVVNHRIIESLSVGMPQNKNRRVNVRKLMAVTLSGRITWRKKI